MAVIWQKQAGKNRYEVRTAGRSVRLYTNGVLHTQFHTGHGVTGSVWDLLLLPALALPEVERVLVLGVGGGAVLRQLQWFAGAGELVGVDLDPVHLQVARRFFGVRGKGVQLIRANAVDWVSANRQQNQCRFDVIVDDLFAGTRGNPERAVACNRAWQEQLEGMLSKTGVLVTNQVSLGEFRQMAVLTEPKLYQRFAEHYKFTTPYYDNHVCASFRVPVDRKALHERLAQWPQLNPRSSQCRLRFTMRRYQPRT